ncbi:MBL fold metallo-hydrolase [Rhizobium rhizogenes]|uniref:MBL fold metallo-hydrolase n=1 Tax=Rhizobium rhizogenes TaxID=359 RepID=UPI001573CE07|nr:MBL fold metallo-hydrolase [Rhizobium rhizogenes]NTF97922.1 MBL fold metallo-hydrolase [Rhizobium rhizogenes]
MMHHRRIGGADVYNIVELIGPTHDPSRVFADLPRSDFEAAAERLGPAQYAATIDRLIIGIQIWVVRIGSEVVVIDTGIGNHKPRGLPRFDRLNTLVPLWLAAAGAAPDQVTQIVMTHLHGDHVGWNTVPQGDGWVPTFPRASYWIPRKDYDWWLPRYRETKGVGETEAFIDAVEPLIDAGCVQFYDEGQEFVPGLRARAAYGHTPGQMRVDLISEGAKGVFCADIFHSPLQILHPELNTPFCVEQETARMTRAAFLNEVADTGMLIMPCHFGPPHCGSVIRAGTGYDFVPERSSICSHLD